MWIYGFWFAIHSSVLTCACIICLKFLGFVANFPQIFVTKSSIKFDSYSMKAKFINHYQETTRWNDCGFWNGSQAIILTMIFTLHTYSTSIVANEMHKRYEKECYYWTFARRNHILSISIYIVVNCWKFVTFSPSNINHINTNESTFGIHDWSNRCLYMVDSPYNFDEIIHLSGKWLFVILEVNVIAMPFCIYIYLFVVRYFCTSEWMNE